MKTKRDFLHSIGYLNCTQNNINLDLLLIPAHARLPNYLNLLSYDFSTLYTTLPHNLIKDKLVDLIEIIFQREGFLYIACNDRHAFFTSGAVKY